MEGPEMGKKSVKEDKNIYFRSREAAGLTRAEASEKTFISESRIEKIEYNNGVPRPDEVIAMAHAYNAAHLCNYYCSHDCQIGQKYVPEIQKKHLTHAVLEMLASFNSFDEYKNRLISISADGVIDESELHDLAVIMNGLKKISSAIDSFNLWVDDNVSSGVIDKDALDNELGKL